MKLKPCPFCGSDKIELRMFTLSGVAQCSVCLACGPPSDGRGVLPMAKLELQTAGRRWNRRKEPKS